MSSWWAKLIGELTLNPLGFPPLWFEPCSGHMWESQVLLTDGQVVFFPWFFSFRPPLMNDWLDISEIFLKGPKTEIIIKKKNCFLFTFCFGLSSIWNMENGI